MTVVAGSTAYELTKRALDLLLGIIGLILTGLASLVVVPLVLLSSDGPAVFTQTRVGKDGRKFTCYSSAPWTRMRNPARTTSPT